jgi:hypothetical protein
MRRARLPLVTSNVIRMQPRHFAPIPENVLEDSSYNCPKLRGNHYDTSSFVRNIFRLVISSLPIIDNTSTIGCKKMLCRQCHSIHFRPLADRSTTTLHCVLHVTRESLDQAVRDRCHLCLLISSKLDADESPESTCDRLGAHVVLLVSSFRRGAGPQLARISNFSVASRRGSFPLRIIDPVLGGVFTPFELPCLSCIDWLPLRHLPCPVYHPYKFK